MSNYKVGYCKPPKNSQFLKGKSGNPGGRPKGSKNAMTVVEEQFLKPVTATQNGKKIKMPIIAAVTAQLLTAAAKGDYKAIKLALEQYTKLIVNRQTGSVADLIGGQSPFDLTAEEVRSISKGNLLKGVK